jgi:hypothetical protein
MYSKEGAKGLRPLNPKACGLKPKGLCPLNPKACGLKPLIDIHTGFKGRSPLAPFEYVQYSVWLRDKGTFDRKVNLLKSSLERSRGIFLATDVFAFL